MYVFEAEHFRNDLVIISEYMETFSNLNENGHVHLKLWIQRVTGLFEMCKVNININVSVRPTIAIHLLMTHQDLA